MRKPPSATLPAVAPVADARYVTQTRKYKLITPLFGGGVDPATADPVSTVRATEVRGQLRFWWRACRAGGYATLAEMKEAEDLLWGAASTDTRIRPSEVQVALTVTNKGRPFLVESDGQPISIGDPKSPYGYAAFPLQDKPEAVTIEGVEFELEITYPSEKAADIEAALWAWETFGGLGGRTRRGFGALALLGTKGDGETHFTRVSHPHPENVEQTIKDGLKDHFVEGQRHPKLPMLPRTTRTGLKIIKVAQAPHDMLATLLRKYQSFRQHRERRFGPSLWPEANAIRYRTNLTVAAPPVDKFPRAVFGLPIIFHFKDDEVVETTLKPLKAERLASSLIIKPVPCSGNRAVGLAILLNAPSTAPDGLILKGALVDAAPDAGLTKDEAAKIPRLHGRVDPLQAFLDDLETL